MEHLPGAIMPCEVIKASFLKIKKWKVERLVGTSPQCKAGLGACLVEGAVVASPACSRGPGPGLTCKTRSAALDHLIG